MSPPIPYIVANCNMTIVVISNTGYVLGVYSDIV